MCERLFPPPDILLEPPKIIEKKVKILKNQSFSKNHQTSISLALHSKYEHFLRIFFFQIVSFTSKKDNVFMNLLEKECRITVRYSS